MDKTVIFAVAGSGKTSRIVEKLDEARQFLIVTYTDANRENLRTKIIERFKYFPPNICLYTYFTFLHGFCYKPFLRSAKNTKGLTFQLPPTNGPMYALTDDRRFITSGRRLYHNRLAKFLEQTGIVNRVIPRIEKYFDAVFVDEVQDFAGHDFNFLTSLCKANVPSLFVGDFYQHTYDTSRDGNVNSSLHADYGAYQKRFKAAKMNVDLTSLAKSHRCSKTVCDFITEKIGIQIESHSDRVSKVTFTDDAATVRALYESRETVKLFLSEHYDYGCYSQNWGAVKGLDHYEDVCVVLNPGNVKAWKAGHFKDINTATKNKLYVACSRARGNLTFVPAALLKPYRSSEKH